MNILPAPILPIVLLFASNIFMTFAWYGHLEFTDRPLWLVVLASWCIAFIEYCFAVPANRYGYAVYSAPQLKTMQEVITLISVCRVFDFLPADTLHAEPCRRLRPDRCGRVFRIQGPALIE